MCCVRICPSYVFRNLKVLKDGLFVCVSQAYSTASFIPLCLTWVSIEVGSPQVACHKVFSPINSPSCPILEVTELNCKPCIDCFREPDVRLQPGYQIGMKVQPHLPSGPKHSGIKIAHLDVGVKHVLRLQPASLKQML